MSRILISTLCGLFLLTSCSTGKCREQKKEQTAAAAAAKPESAPPLKPVGPPAELSATQPGTRKEPSVKVFKFDGSKQCGEAAGVELNEMEKQLKGIKILAKQKSNDGKMRVQMCGADTGEINLYEIPSADLAKAQKAGFKELK